MIYCSLTMSFQSRPLFLSVMTTSGARVKWEQVGNVMGFCYEGISQNLNLKVC